MSVAVEANGLTKRFGGFTAVDRISFAIEAGTIWGFLGPNGAGKSTTIRMLCGILDPSAGNARILGTDVARYPERVRERIGYVSQKSSVWPDLTVAEHLRFYADMYGDATAHDSGFRDWLEMFDLVAYRDVLGAALPQGFRQRLAFACAAVHHPEVLFLDEPTAGVDPVSRRRFWDRIGAMSAAGSTIVVTTHYLDEAEHCHRIAFIAGGRIIAEGTPAQLRSDNSYGQAVEVTTKSPIGALEAVELLPYVRAATLSEAALHVMLPSTAFIPRLTTALVDAQVDVIDVRPTNASLEDVFASATAQREIGTS